MMLRVLFPLLGILAALALGATPMINSMTRSWFQRDVTLRARLATTSAREALASHVLAGNRKRLGAVLNEIVRDDRIMAATACTPSMNTLAKTPALPASFSCEALAGRILGDVSPNGVDLFEEPNGGLLRAAVIPVMEEEQVLGRLGASHAGHRPGRTSPTVGGRCTQRLTSSPAWSIRILLRSPATTGPGHDGGRAETRFPSPASRAGGVPVPLLARPDTITSHDRQSPTYAVALTALTRHFPSRCSRAPPRPATRKARQHK